MFGVLLLPIKKKQTKQNKKPPAYNCFLAKLVQLAKLT